MQKTEENKTQAGRQAQSRAAQKKGGLKPSTARFLVMLAVLVLLAIGLICGISFGTLSALGWRDISLLCPIGALTTMIATRTLIPRAVISVVLMLVGVLLVGRFFCGWMCPVPLAVKVRDFFKSSKRRKREAKQTRQMHVDIAEYELGIAHDCKACGKCKTPKRFDSRHLVLAGALLSTAIFGFPVFCAICPIGLTFGLITLVFRLFAFGDVTASILIVIALLVVELVVLKHWCLSWCPISGLMALVSRFGKTTIPEIDNDLCLETTKGTPCSRCATSCDMNINLRHPEYGWKDLADCTRCHACVEVCPTHAVKMRPVNRRSARAMRATQGGGRFRAEGAVFTDADHDVAKMARAAARAAAAASESSAAAKKAGE